jgi:hypothetical protein
MNKRPSTRSFDLDQIPFGSIEVTFDCYQQEVTMADTSNDFSAMARKGFDSFAAHQNAFLQELNTFRQHWADAAEAQLNATAELMNKLASTRTLPDLVGACQDCASKRGSLMAEDGKLLLNDYQRCAAAAAKCLINGFKAPGLTPAASS